MILNNPPSWRPERCSNSSQCMTECTFFYKIRRISANIASPMWDDQERILIITTQITAQHITTTTGSTQTSTRRQTRWRKRNNNDFYFYIEIEFKKNHSSAVIFPSIVNSRRLRCLCTPIFFRPMGKFISISTI